MTSEFHPFTKVRPDQHDAHKGKGHRKDGIRFHKTHACIATYESGECFCEGEKDQPHNKDTNPNPHRPSGCQPHKLTKQRQEQSKTNTNKPHDGPHE